MTENEPDFTDDWEQYKNPDGPLPNYHSPKVLRLIGGKLLLFMHRNTELLQYHPKFEMDAVSVTESAVAGRVLLFTQGDPEAQDLWDQLEDEYYTKKVAYRPDDEVAESFIKYQRRRLEPGFIQFEDPIGIGEPEPNAQWTLNPPRTLGQPSYFGIQEDKAAERQLERERQAELDSQYIRDPEEEHGED